MEGSASPASSEKKNYMSSKNIGVVLEQLNDYLIFIGLLLG